MIPEVRVLAASVSLVLLVAFAGCRQEWQLISNGPFILSKHRKIDAHSPLLVTGPMTEVCFKLLPPAKTAGGGRVVLETGRNVRFTVTVFDDKSRSTEWTRADGIVTWTERDSRACVGIRTPRLAGWRLVSLQLEADSPVIVKELRWWSGRRVPVL